MTAQKILIVDDEPQVHRMLETVLKPRGYEIITASDGMEALNKIRSDRPALVLLDIMMPELNGIEVCERIRQDENLKDTLVVMLSAKDAQQDRITGLQYGADDYVTKPFHVQTLVHKIDYMLQKRRQKA